MRNKLNSLICKNSGRYLSQIKSKLIKDVHKIICSILWVIIFCNISKNFFSKVSLVIKKLGRCGGGVLVVTDH